MNGSYGQQVNQANRPETRRSSLVLPSSASVISRGQQRQQQADASSSSSSILGRRSTRSTSSLRPLSLFGSDSNQLPISPFAINSLLPSSRASPSRRHSLAISPRSPLSPTAIRHPDYVAIPATARRETLRTSRGRSIIGRTSRRAPPPPPSSSDDIATQTGPFDDSNTIGSTGNHVQTQPVQPPTATLTARDIRAARREQYQGLRSAINLPASAVSVRVIRSPSPEGERLTLPKPPVITSTVTSAGNSRPPQPSSPTRSSRPAFSIGRSDPSTSLVERLSRPRRLTRSTARISPDRTNMAYPSRSRANAAAGPSSHRFPSPSPSSDSLVDMSASITPSLGHKPPSFESGSHGPLACKAEIVLEKGGNVMSMFGGPRTGVAYSLPGHVVISIPNLPVGAGSAEQGGAGRQRELKMLDIVFEGKNEFFDEAGRYQAMRLVQVRKSLLPESGEAQIIPHCPPSPNSLFPQAETKYAMGFDMAIPGWLPASFENDVSSVSYGIVCFATIGWAKEGASVAPTQTSMETSSVPVAIPTTLSLTASSSANSGFRTMLTRGLSSAMSSFSGTQWAVSSKENVQTSWTTITVNRHRAYASPTPIVPDGVTAPAPAPPPEHTLRHFTLKPSEDSPSPIECLISVPDTVDINGPNVRIGVRIRARKGFTIVGPELPQTRARTAASAAETAEAPEDTDMDQGVGPAAGEEADTGGAASDGTSTVKPKRSLGTIRMVELGMEIEETERYSSTAAQPFLAAYPVPEDQPNSSDPASGQHALLSPPSRLAEMHSLGFKADPEFSGTRSRTLLLGDDGKPRSYKFDKEGLELGAGWRKVNVIVPMPNEAAQQAGSRRPMSELDSPFARIKHKLKIRITCRCSTMPGKDTLVVLTTPLRCGTAPVERQLDLPYITGQSAQPLADVPLSLPAYNQIFHENGNTREDDDPLPIYDAKKEDAPPYSPGRAIARMPNHARSRRSTPAREAMDLSRSDLMDPMDPASVADASAVEELVGHRSALSALFASPSTSAGMTPSTANIRQGSSFLLPPHVGSSSIWSPATSFGDIPMPRQSPLSWSHPDLSPSASPHPLGSAIGMSMMTGAADMSMESDLNASTSSLRDVMSQDSGQLGTRRVAKPIEVPVGRGGPSTRRSLNGAPLQLGIPPAARRR